MTELEFLEAKENTELLLKTANLLSNAREKLEMDIGVVNDMKNEIRANFESKKHIFYGGSEPEKIRNEDLQCPFLL